MTRRAAATRYARALFDVVRKEKEADLQRVETELTSFTALVSANEPLQHALVAPSIPAARKRAVVESLLTAGGPLAPALSKLLLLLAERDRLSLLADLADAYRDRLREHQQIVSAEVVTAVPLTEDRRAALERGIAAATGRTVVLSAAVDPGIIGGAITRIGSTVYDGSVARQLERLREQLQTS
jgi:F-type H+-transporting ATPase subunit delta